MTISERLYTWWERPPKSYSTSIVGNYLGLQFLRVAWLNVSRGFGWYRPAADIQEYAEVLTRDGVVTISNFLPPDIFARITEAYQDAVSLAPLKPLAAPYVVPADGQVRVGVVHLIPKPNTALYTLLEKYLETNDMVCRLGSVIVKHRIKRFREPQVFMNRIMNQDAPDLNSDIYYHADVPYPGVKAFLYLTDVTKDSGAFTYVKGSHKLTMKRWWWEYIKSIRWARDSRRSGLFGDSKGRGWHCLTRSEEKEYGLQGTPIEGTANTLVVFNVMGFHRRGGFVVDRPRAFALAYYRI